jgi:hypothetical protein
MPGSAEGADRRRHTADGHLGTDWPEVFHKLFGAPAAQRKNFAPRTVSVRAWSK